MLSFLSSTTSAEKLKTFYTQSAGKWSTNGFNIEAYLSVKELALDGENFVKDDLLNRKNLCSIFTNNNQISVVEGTHGSGNTQLLNHIGDLWARNHENLDNFEYV